MALLQKFSLPIAIVIAGGLIAISLYFINAQPKGAQTAAVMVQSEIRSVQKDDHVLGNPNADIVIVEYSDPECPYCKQFQQTLHDTIAQYGASGKVAWIYRHWPVLSSHPKGQKEAEALECAAEQGGPSSTLGTKNDLFFKYTDAIYATTTSNNSLDIGIYNTPTQIPLGQDGRPAYTQQAPRSATDAGKLSDIARSLGLDVTKFESCLKNGTYAARVTEDANEVIAAGGTGTPFSIMIIGGEQMPLEGAQPLQTMRGLIESSL